MSDRHKDIAEEMPALAYDGGNIYVLMDVHDEAVEWFTRHMGWNIQHKFDNKPKNSENAIVRERKTVLDFGTSIQSIELRDGSNPLPTVVSVESRVRCCWRTKDLSATRSYLQKEGARVGELYRGPGDFEYFDFWATSENILLTAQGDPNVPVDSPRFVPSWNRIGVIDLQSAKQWYEAFVGMRLLEDHSEKGYLLMGLNLEHHPNENSQWVLEEYPGETAIRLLNGAARPNCVLHDKQEFAEYHAYLKSQGIVVSEILGYPPIQGFSWFHFYDQDGNRFDIYRY